MQQRLDTIQREAEEIKQQLKKSFPTLQDANPGDLLEDGTVVIQKYENAALIAAPKETEVCYPWSEEFTPVFNKLQEHNFNPSQWFIPSAKQVQLAYKNAEQHFSGWWYWSSTEASSTNACSVGFNIGLQLTFSKANTYCVRAFRLVEL
jgi:hypothetical protein